MFDLTGKVAIVTGASRGIGEAIALALSQAGAAVALTSRKLENVVPVADKIQAAGGQALALQAHAGVSANAVYEAQNGSCPDSALSKAHAVVTAGANH